MRIRLGINYLPATAREMLQNGAEEQFLGFKRFIDGGKNGGQLRMPKWEERNQVQAKKGCAKIPERLVEDRSPLPRRVLVRRMMCMAKPGSRAVLADPRGDGQQYLQGTRWAMACAWPPIFLRVISIFAKKLCWETEGFRAVFGGCPSYCSSGRE
jgi:hypothetical protein